MAQEDRVAQVERRDRRRTGRGPRRRAARCRGSVRDAMLDDDGADRPAVGDHRRRPGGCARRAGRRPGAGCASGSSRGPARSSRRSQARPTMASGRSATVGTSVAPRDARTISLLVRRADDDAALEAEPVGQPVEDDRATGGPDRHVVEPRADVDERLEVGAALAKLALVHGREDRRRQGEQPERRHVEDGHPVELDRRARR